MCLPLERVYYPAESNNKILLETNVYGFSVTDCTFIDFYFLEIVWVKI